MKVRFFPNNFWKSVWVSGVVLFGVSLFGWWEELVVLWVALLVHEGGHLLVGWAVGVRAIAVQLGLAPEIVVLETPTVRVGVGLNVLSGFVRLVPFKGFGRRILILLAGPLAGIILGLILFRFRVPEVSASPLGWEALSFTSKLAWFNFAIGTGNLLPLWNSDGKQLALTVWDYFDAPPYTSRRRKFGVFLDVCSVLLLIGFALAIQ